VWCDMCAWLRRWCRMVLCSLYNNKIGPEGAAAISGGLASLSQLQTLEYVVAVCVRWWCGCGAGTRGARCAGLEWECAGSVCVGMRAGVPVCVWCDMCAWLRR
jgi:hypothetical protein